MDAVAIAVATGLPVRRIRYVLEQRVLPGTEKASRGNRVTRDFTAFEAFGIALTAVMLEFGIGRRTTTEVLHALMKPRAARNSKSTAGLLDLFETSSTATIEVIDGQRLRWSTTPSSKPSWHDSLLATTDVASSSARASAAEDEPLIVVRISAHRVRDMIKRADRKK